MLKFNAELKELHDMNHRKNTAPGDLGSDPEGIELEDDDQFENPFFKD